MKTLTLLFLLLLAQQQQRQTITDAQAKAYIGENMIVCGEVKGVFHHVKGKGQPLYLSFGAPYPHQTFTAVIWGQELHRFAYNIADSLLHKTVCLSGRVGEFKGKPQMVIYKPEQVTVK